MLANLLSLPSTRPFSYGQLREEPVFDPKRHLALEPPSRRWTLGDFGYSEEEAGSCASPVAVAGAFRLLSEQGAEAARVVARALDGSRQASDRTASYLAGGVYRSRFLRDLCNCPDVTAFMSEMAGSNCSPTACLRSRSTLTMRPRISAKRWIPGIRTQSGSTACC